MAQPSSQHSLFKEIFRRILVASLLFTFIFSVGFIFWAYDRARDEQDDRLEATALLLARQTLAQNNPSFLHWDEDRLEDTIFDQKDNRKLLQANHPVPVYLLRRGGQVQEFRFSIPLTIGEHSIAFDGKDYRLSLVSISPKQYYAVAESLREVNEKVFEQILQTTLPLFIFILFLWCVVGFSLWLSLKPLRRFAQEVQNRDSSQLDQPLLAQSLPQEIQPLVHAFNRLLGKIRQAHIREKRFTADAAHELRSPLTALQLDIEFLRKENLPSRIHETLGRIHAGLARCIRQVSQLLTLARAQAQTSPTRKTQPWTFTRLYVELLEELYDTAQQKNITIELVGLENDPPQTQRHRRAQRTILRNLIENAIHYTPENGTITITHTVQNQQLCIQVSDTGIGIPDEYKKRVFDPFFRILGNQAPGTGLGLSIVRRLVEQRGGIITLKDNHPQGLCVEIVYS